MRKIILSTALAVFAITSVSAQNLDKVLNDYFKASAQEKMTKIKTISTSGKNVYTAMGMEAGFALYQSRPNNLRVEAEFQGSKIIQTYNGTTGWMYAPAMGISVPQEMGADELKAVLTQAEFESPLWKYKEKGHQAELDGESEDGKAHQVKLTMENGDVMTFLISKETNLLSGMTTIPTGGRSRRPMGSIQAGAVAPWSQPWATRRPINGRLPSSLKMTATGASATPRFIRSMTPSSWPIAAVGAAPPFSRISACGGSN